MRNIIVAIVNMRRFRSAGADFHDIIVRHVNRIGSGGQIQPAGCVQFCCADGNLCETLLEQINTSEVMF